MRNLIPASVTRAAAKSALKMNHHSPTILFAAGVVGMIGTAVLASRATLKVEEKVARVEKDMVALEEIANISEQEKEQMKKSITLHFVGDMAKLYAPAVITGVASVACLTKSHTILLKRNAALTAAYVVLEKAFNEYRARVKGELGDEADQHFMHGTKELQFLDPETGKVETVKTAAQASGYSEWFDAENVNFQHIQQYNLNFLSGHQRALNNRLKTRGFVFLNEAREALGFPATREGQVVGWWWDGDGDNFIDFGVFDGPNTLNVLDRRRGGDGSLLIDFNVDGNIANRLGTKFVS